MRDNVSESPLQLIVQPDLFDGLLVIARYGEATVDVYSVDTGRYGAGSWQLRYMDKKTGRWRRFSACYVDINDPAFRVQARSVSGFLFSHAEETFEYIQWLGVDEALQAFAFFSCHPHWMRQDYPCAYVLLVWHFRDLLTPLESDGLITRALLCRLTGIDLSRSQLKNIRKLSDNGRASDLLAAALNLVYHFDVLKELVLHQPTLDPHWVNTVAGFAKRYECFRFLTWKKRLLANESLERIGSYILPMIEAVADDAFIIREDVCFETFVRQQVTSLEKARLLFEDWVRRSVADDEGFYLSAYDQGAFFFPPVPLVSDECFKWIATAMDMHKAALDLDNCAFDCVEPALNGESTYFFYSGRQTAEWGMVEIILLDDDRAASGMNMHVEQFLSVANKPVSAIAIGDLILWCDRQSHPIMVDLDTSYGNLQLSDTAGLACAFRHARCGLPASLRGLLEERYEALILRWITDGA